MIDILSLKRKALRHTPCLGSFSGGGIGNSQPTSNTKTENADMRVVGGNDSINTSTKLAIKQDGIGNTITTTDYGSVGAALKLAMNGVEQANATAQQAVASSGGILDGALHNQAASTQQFVDSVTAIKTTDVRVLVIAGLVVVGLGAAFVFKGKA